MRVAIYARKSVSDPQSESIENQINLSTQYCKDKFKYKSIHEYCDKGYSGKNTNRPGFQKLLTDIQSNRIDTILVYKMDRLFRNTKDFYSMLDIFEKYNIKFISITENFDLDSSSGRVMAGIYSIFAQFERESISQRIKDNMYQSAKKGSWMGGPAPFGYKFNRYCENNKKLCYLEIDTEKSEIVKLLFSRYLKFKSLTRLEQYVREHSITGARGNIFNLTSLASILRSPVYVKSTPEVVTYLESQNMNVTGTADYIHGFTTYAKNDSFMQPLATVSHHDGIIDGDMWLNVQKILSQNSKMFPRQGTGKKALLSGLLKCKHCGSNMNISYKRKDTSGKQLSYYMCSTKKRRGRNACHCSNLNSDYIDTLILDQVNDIDIEILLKMFINRNIFNNDLNSHSDEISLIKNNINLKNKKLSTLINSLSIAPNEIIINNMMQKMESISDEIADLQCKLTNLKSNSDEDFDNKSIETITNILYNFKNFLEDESLQSKQDFIKSIIDRIEWDSEKEELDILFK